MSGGAPAGVLAWLLTIGLVVLLGIVGLIVIGFLPIVLVAMPITTLILLAVVIWALARRR